MVTSEIIKLFAMPILNRIQNSFNEDNTHEIDLYHYKESGVVIYSQNGVDYSADNYEPRHPNRDFVQVYVDGRCMSSLRADVWTAINEMKAFLNGIRIMKGKEVEIFC